MLPDVQNTKDHRNISIHRVGISDYVFPIKVRRKGGGYVDTSASVNLFVDLPKDYKGTNVSRFACSLVEFSHHPISAITIPRLLKHLKHRLQSNNVYARFEFDYFIDKVSPVSKMVAPQNYRCAFTGIEHDNNYTFVLEVNVVAAALCACSKAMSLLRNSLEEIKGELCEIADHYGKGAHNQRSRIRLEIVPKEGKFVWIEDLVDLLESCASAPTYPILKRPDEKYVTELAYENPKFSEDITRDIQLAIEERDDIHSWSLKVSNEESIHPYNVVCYQRSDNWRGL